MRYFTSDTHFGHPLVSALRGFINDADLKSTYMGVWRDQGRDAAHAWIKQYVRDNKTAFRRIADTSAHDRTIVSNINGVVGEDDELWILGDISFRSPIEYVRQCLESINCRHLHMVIGNHDFNFGTEGRANDAMYEGLFESIDSYAQITMQLPVLNDAGNIVAEQFAEQDVGLSHFPRRSAMEADVKMEYASLPIGSTRFLGVAPQTDGWLLYGHTHQEMPYGTDPQSVNVGLDAWQLRPPSEQDVIDCFLNQYSMA